jgi:SAM-dependent methyltransferase
VKDVPPDYYRRLHAVEQSHWWHVGMRKVAASILGERLRRQHLQLLDAGCGTGGFLAWAYETGAFERLCGVDISPEAIEFAGHEVPAADVRVAPLDDLPFERGSFDLVTLNDVLQHVEEGVVRDGLCELRRVVREDGALLVRTNSGRRPRRERSDWRLYDESTLRSELEGAAFDVVRLTHANALLSVWGAARRRTPKAPTTTSCGIPSGAGSFANTVGGVVFALEARYLREPRRRLPYGHTLFALATPAAGG